jgi:hypothetical protein
MKRNAVYGVGRGIDGREAAMQASQQALDQLGTARPVLALVFVSQEFVVADALSGLVSLLGDTPVWGFSTLRPLTEDGDQPRSVVVALLTGSDLKAQVEWFPTFSQDASGAARQFAQSLRQGSFLPQDILFVADGIHADVGPLCAALADLPYGVSGCTAAGEAALGKTYQIGKHQSGAGALSALVLGGRFRLGVGMAHGWRSVGAFFRATRTRDVWVQALDAAPAVETYVRYFGYTPREWAFPPLTDMARLYPLGVEMSFSGSDAGGGYSVGEYVPGAGSGLLLRSPLRVEVDGSLRMSAPVPQGAVVHLMVGDPGACVQAAYSAAQSALLALNAGRGGKIRPTLAVALADVAWQYLFETRPTQVAAALKSALGDIPLVGAYTLGQIARPQPGAAPVIQNQNLAVVIFGEAVE